GCTCTARANTGRGRLTSLVGADIAGGDLAIDHGQVVLRIAQAEIRRRIQACAVTIVEPGIGPILRVHSRGANAGEKGDQEKRRDLAHDKGPNWLASFFAMPMPALNAR